MGRPWEFYLDKDHRVTPTMSDGFYVPIPDSSKIFCIWCCDSFPVEMQNRHRQEPSHFRNAGQRGNRNLENRVRSVWENLMEVHRENVPQLKRPTEEALGSLLWKGGCIRAGYPIKVGQYDAIDKEAGCGRFLMGVEVGCARLIDEYPKKYKFECFLCQKTPAGLKEYIVHLESDDHRREYIEKYLGTYVHASVTNEAIIDTSSAMTRIACALQSNQGRFMLWEVSDRDFSEFKQQLADICLRFDGRGHYTDCAFIASHAFNHPCKFNCTPGDLEESGQNRDAQRAGGPDARREVEDQHDFVDYSFPRRITQPPSFTQPRSLFQRPTPPIREAPRPGQLPPGPPLLASSRVPGPLDLPPAPPLPPNIRSRLSISPSDPRLTPRVASSDRDAQSGSRVPSSRSSSSPPRDPRRRSSGGAGGGGGGGGVVGGGVATEPPRDPRVRAGTPPGSGVSRDPRLARRGSCDERKPLASPAPREERASDSDGGGSSNMSEGGQERVPPGSPSPGLSGASRPIQEMKPSPAQTQRSGQKRPPDGPESVAPPSQPKLARQEQPDLPLNVAERKTIKEKAEEKGLKKVMAESSESSEGSSDGSSSDGYSSDGSSSDGSSDSENEDMDEGGVVGKDENQSKPKVMQKKENHGGSKYHGVIFAPLSAEPEPEPDPVLPPAPMVEPAPVLWPTAGTADYGDWCPYIEKPLLGVMLGDALRELLHLARTLPWVRPGQISETPSLLSALESATNASMDEFVDACLEIERDGTTGQLEYLCLLMMQGDGLPREGKPIRDYVGDFHEAMMRLSAFLSRVRELKVTLPESEDPEAGNPSQGASTSVGVKEEPQDGASFASVEVNPDREKYVLGLLRDFGGIIKQTLKNPALPTGVDLTLLRVVRKELNGKTVQQAWSVLTKDRLKELAEFYKSLSDACYSSSGDNSHPGYVLGEKGQEALAEIRTVAVHEEDVPAPVAVKQEPLAQFDIDAPYLAGDVGDEQQQYTAQLIQAFLKIVNQVVALAGQLVGRCDFDLVRHLQRDLTSANSLPEARNVLTKQRLNGFLDWFKLLQVTSVGPPDDELQAQCRALGLSGCGAVEDLLAVAPDEEHIEPVVKQETSEEPVENSSAGAVEREQYERDVIQSYLSVVDRVLAGRLAKKFHSSTPAVDLGSIASAKTTHEALSFFTKEKLENIAKWFKELKASPADDYEATLAVDGCSAVEDLMAMATSGRILEAPVVKQEPSIQFESTFRHLIASGNENERHVIELLGNLLLIFSKLLPSAEELSHKFNFCPVRTMHGFLVFAESVREVFTVLTALELRRFEGWFIDLRARCSPTVAFESECRLLSEEGLKTIRELQAVTQPGAVHPSQ